jgi:hypothetical protein
MNAMEAKLIALSAKQQGITKLRTEILKSIENAAKIGKTSITLWNNENYYLQDEDFDWFESLGYKCTRPVQTVYVPEGYPIEHLRSGVEIKFLGQLTRA